MGSAVISMLENILLACGRVLYVLALIASILGFALIVLLIYSGTIEALGLTQLYWWR